MVHGPSSCRLASIAWPHWPPSASRQLGAKCRRRGAARQLGEAENSPRAQRQSFMVSWSTEI